jgi:GWxTD domain-containing protein
MPSLLQKFEYRHLKSNGAWLALLVCFSGLALIPAIPTARAQFSDNAASTKIQNPAEVGDFFSQGMKQKVAGNWQKALDIWWESKEILTEKSLTEPRIGTAFIELVTQKKATQFYETASNLYYWGFSNKTALEFHKEIEKEMERLRPLLSEDRYKAWAKDVEDKNPELLIKILGFWIDKDPIPTTPINERLLEHWERIAYAREHFTKGSYTAYGTDDRGVIYVKYGNPDRKKSGFLGQGTSEIRAWVDDIFQADEEKGNPTTIQEDIQSWSERNSIIRSLVMSNPLPEYEAWVYYGLNSGNPLTYLFGRKEDRGAFRLVNGVEDFIPKREFNRYAEVGGILPGSIYQLAYYSDLFILGGIFEDRYNELESLWQLNLNSGHAPNNRIIRGMRNKFVSADVHDMAKLNAPSEKSGYDDIIKPISIACTQARFLDQDNEPTIALIASSSSPVFGVENLAGLIGGTGQTPYFIRHTLILRDTNWNETQRVEDYPPVGGDQTTVFFIRQSGEIKHKVFVAEAIDSQGSHKDTNPTELFYASDAIASGKAPVPKLEPLSSNPNRLEISDLILGINVPVSTDTARYPFPAIPSGRISKASPLQLYFEVYHLDLGSNKKAEYMVQYQIEKPIRRGIIGRVFGGSKKKQVVSLLSNYESISSRTKENMAFDISRVEPGQYEFLVEITDRNSNQKKSRKISFEIVE